MEQRVNSVVNFGIGCWNALSERYEGISERIRSSVDELIVNGEKSKATAAVKIREMAGRATDFFRRGEKTHKTTRAA